MIRRKIALIYWVLALAFFLPNATYAYIDPATTTYIIQIITALVVTVGVSLSIFLYRFKMISAKMKYSLYGLFSRREKSTSETKKEVGEEYSLPSYAMAGTRTPPSEEDMRALGEPTDIEILLPKETLTDPGRRNYTGRLKSALPVSLGLCLSFILISSLELIMQNSADIPFRPGVVLPDLIILTIVCFVLMSFVIPAFHGKPYDIIICIFLTVLIAGYIQGNYMNGVLGELNGEAIQWDLYYVQFATSVATWSIILVCIILLMLYSKNAWRKLIIFAPILLIIVQSVALTTLIDDYKASGYQSFWDHVEENLTIEGLAQPAAEKNAIVFVLDRLDDDFCDEIEKNNPGFFANELDGFTRFDDNISNYSGTFPAVATMLTGNRYMYDMPMHDYFDYAWANAKMMHELKEHDVDIRLYMDRGYAYDSAYQIREIANNTFKGNLEFNKRIALVKLLKLSGFRYAPMPMKSIFWLSPTEFNDSLDLTDSTAIYITNDFAFYDNIVTNRLKPSDNSNTAFLYYHLLGAHGPLNMDENLMWIEESTRVSQATGCFKIVFEYLQQLKELGLYEDATIIITGDHGDFLGTDLHKPMHTALFVKPAGNIGTPLAYSHAPVSPDQLQATIMQGLFGDNAGFGPTYLEINEGDEVTRESAVEHWRYKITGDGRDFANWKLFGMFPDDWM